MFHVKFRAPPDQLSLQLKLNDGNGLVHLLIQHSLLHIIILLPVIQLESLAAVLVIQRHSQPRQGDQVDPIALFQDVQIAILGTDTDDIGDTAGIARRSPHPQYVVIAPLNVHGMMLHQRVHHQVRIRPPVINITHHMKMIYHEAADQSAQRHDQLLGAPGADDGMDDLVIIAS